MPFLYEMCYYYLKTCFIAIIITIILIISSIISVVIKFVALTKCPNLRTPPIIDYHHSDVA